MGAYDPTSYSDPREAKIQHIDINWTVDFSRKVLSGYVDLKFKSKKDNLSSLILDSKDLAIHKITDGKADLKFKIKERHAAFGSPLQIDFVDSVKQDEEFTLHIEYETSSSCSALQWLDAEQTAGQKYPYLFSQCQAIHARSLLPCQDSPSAKATYTAKVTVQHPLVALMSAVQCWDKAGKGENGEKLMTYKFEQKVPMSSYLIAIVVGLLESREIGPRSKVWSEKELVDKAALEFSETEQMIAAGEKLVGPYVWGQYDLLVLPPSFPYGGMENPCLTFVTPTLLAGDKSLANVVAHEIAHSWTGNLVTNHTWEDFWLNEGHTVFLERKIICELFDDKFRQFQAFNGLKDLHQYIETFGKDSPFTHLVVNLDGVDPDDAFSPIPYEKGHTLLFHLETLLGGPSEFEPFLRSYIDKYKFESVSTSQWKDHLYEFFSSKKAVLDSLDWNAWFHTPGMPPVIPEYDQTLSTECTALAEKWAKTATNDLGVFKAKDIKHFSSWQKIEFLGQLLLKDPFTSSHISTMDSCYRFSKINNSEIKFRWLRLGIRARYEPSIRPALQMATDQGRMKFTRPLFRDLGGWDKSRDVAIDHFKKNKAKMHNTTAQHIEKDLKL
ncbi:leukotriene A-4 hydrolase-like isoform X1 [Clavelina lepadiformis]|uniref:leukotriene A-4 hydrolase-like isoform X1 n=1 Tax=Clavelina lepadiformis TaxID=159417 RepID=UPI00404177B8